MEFHTTTDTQTQAAAHLTALLQAYAQEPTLLLVSGGSVLEMLAYVGEDQFSEHITLGLIDERCTTQKDDRNAIALKESTFYARAKNAGVQLLEPRVRKSDTPTSAAQRYEEQLRQWRHTHPDAHIIAVLGIGADGHTAGMLPTHDDPLRFEALFIDTLHWVSGYEYFEGDTNHPRRFTVTVPFLEKEVNDIVIYATGEEKCPVLGRLKSALGHPAALPALVLRECERVHIFTDCTLE